MTTSIFSCRSMRRTPPQGPGLTVIGYVLVLLILCAGTGPAQELTGANKAEAVFQEAVNHYRQADYYRALMGFRALLRDDPENRRVTAALLMQAKCYYWLQNYDQAVASLESLLTKYPNTTYRDNAKYLLGNCRYRQGQYWRSADQLRQVIAESDDPRLTDLARNSLRALISEQLSLRQLSNLYEDLPSDDVSPWILLEMARRELSQGHREEALARAEEVLRLFPDGKAAQEAQALRSRAGEKAPRRLTIGVVCPLSGTYADYGNDLRHGVELAIEEHQSLSDIEVSVQVKDSGGLAVQAVRAAKELIEDQGVVALVGPLLSANAVGMGAVCDCHSVPMITPTAAEENIAQVGRFVFQRSVSSRALGERMAAYGVGELDLHTFAVLAPWDSHGQAAVEGFTRVAEEEGARVLAVTWYQTGDTDFKEQLLQIRRLKQAYDDSLVALGLLPSVEIHSEPDTLPSSERRVYIDGLFVPAAPQEAGMIAPQIAFHRLETLICGTSGWGGREARRIGGRYLDGIHFATDFVEELSNPRYQEFAASFADRYGHHPGKVAVFSYECALLLLQGIATGAYTPEALYQFLSHTEDFPGLAGNISLTRGLGANDEVMILTIQDGRLIRLE
jgi:ABC-type branched-subunit amino acid transport system substrate-binding protein/predicted negative regulator of RcsB-dependent stress response